jgi:hypothetical protein
MKNQKIGIRINLVEMTRESRSSKSEFWKIVKESSNLELENPDRLEYIFKKEFPRVLKREIRNKFRSELREFEKAYSSGIETPYLEEYFHFRRFEKSEKMYFDDFVIGLSKLQEIKNEYFKDNLEYQKLLNKNLLAAQIDFGVENIKYSSLDFDLSIEPIEKMLQLFDNNFDFFKIFLDSYISESFLSSVSIYNGNLPIDTSISYSESLVQAFNSGINSKKQPLSDNLEVNQKEATKWDKAKWVWSLANGSLVVPVILSLLILFVAFNKLEKLDSIRQENKEKIQIDNDKIINNYHQLIDVQNKTYNDLIKSLDKDSTKLPNN